MTDAYRTVLEVLSTLGDKTPDDTSGLNAIAAILGITDEEAVSLATAVHAICEGEDIVGFSIGLKLGERVGYGRGVATLLSSSPDEPEED